MSLSQFFLLHFTEVCDILRNMKCKFCEAGHSDDAGGYYDSMACERKWILNKLDAETDPDKIDKLQRQLWLASYTGD